jgi:hypothetical protein
MQEIVCFELIWCLWANRTSRLGGSSQAKCTRPSLVDTASYGYSADTRNNTPIWFSRSSSEAGAVPNVEIVARVRRQIPKMQQAIKAEPRMISQNWNLHLLYRLTNSPTLCKAPSLNSHTAPAHKHAHSHKPNAHSFSLSIFRTICATCWLIVTKSIQGNVIRHEIVSCRTELLVAGTEITIVSGVWLSIATLMRRLSFNASLCWKMLVLSPWFARLWVAPRVWQHVSYAFLAFVGAEPAFELMRSIIDTREYD